MTIAFDNLWLVMDAISSLQGEPNIDCRNITIEQPAGATTVHIAHQGSELFYYGPGNVGPLFVDVPTPAIKAIADYLFPLVTN